MPKRKRFGGEGGQNIGKSAYIILKRSLSDCHVIGSHISDGCVNDSHFYDGFVSNRHVMYSILVRVVHADFRGLAPHPLHRGLVTYAKGIICVHF